MTDLSIDHAQLERITQKLESAAERLVLEARVGHPEGTGLRSDIAADALDEAARRHRIQAEQLHLRLTELAEQPATVAERFAQEDRVLGEVES